MLQTVQTALLKIITNMKFNKFKMVCLKCSFNMVLKTFEI